MQPEAVVYRRVSTDDQVDFGLSLRQQEEGGRAELARMGWSLGAVHADEGVSGGVPLAGRPGLKEAIRALRPGGFLVVRDLSRIARGGPHLVGEIEEAVEARGARIWSVAGEGTHSDGANDVFMRRISYGLGEHFKLTVRDNTRKTMRDKRRAGERLGQVPYGKRIAADGTKLEDDPRGLEARAAAWRLHSEGHGPRRIARELTALGFRAAGKRPGRIHLRDVELLLQRVGQGRPLDQVAAELAGQMRRNPRRRGPDESREAYEARVAHWIAHSPRRGDEAPTAGDLAAVLELSRSGLEPRQVLARLEAIAAASPPPPGETFPETTVRHFLRQGPPP